MKVSDFDYELPEELIAQKPVKDRISCRLMVVDKSTGNIEHKTFIDILNYLNPGDCLVLNDSRVIPARIFGEKIGTGAKIEFLLIKRIEPSKYPEYGIDEVGERRDDQEVWQVMARPGKRLHVGDKVLFFQKDTYEGDIDNELFSFDHFDLNDSLIAEILGDGQDGTKIVRFKYQGVFMEVLEKIGAMPLPPYIDRPATDEDREDYQTVYSKVDGSVAAPTAGLHFTEELLSACEKKGVKLAYLTLHVGIGTFRPVKVDTIEDHHMHFEEYTVSEQTAEIVNSTIESGGRIISVGTTSVRTLESAAEEIKRLNPNDNSNVVMAEDGQEMNKKKKYVISPGSGSTDIFIYPGYDFKIVDSLITNFHLPKSTLIMLVSAMVGRDEVLEAYNEAVKENYRFFSYGDAMLIK